MDMTLPDFTKAKVLIIGDIMLDRYWYGNTLRISPEAPVPVVHVNNIEESPGGAANVALNVKALDGQANLHGLVGEDDNAITLTNMLQDIGVDCHLQQIAKFPTITKMRVMAQHQQLIRLDFENNFAAVDTTKLLVAYTKQLANVDIVVISDYGKSIVNIIPELIKIARKHEVPVLVDPKGADFSIYQGATVITPNLAEFEAVVGACVDEADIENKGKQLLHAHKFAAVLVTRGAQGMSLIRNNSKPLHISTEAREVYDVTGAGDTVIATLATVLAVSQDMELAVKLANTAAGIVVQKLGSAAASAIELRRTLRSKHDSWLGIVNEKRLLEEVKDAKAHGETIVMTNGCFDILHAGHIAYLKQAKTLGARLIVAVNDDASVRKLKGVDRPINHLEQRMAILAGLRCIDWVVSFSEQTPARIIAAVTPDVLVKGGDWKVEQIIGSEHVQKHGGKVISLPYIDDQSTTNIINKIRS